MTTTVGNIVSGGSDDTVPPTTNGGALSGDNPNPIWLVAIDRVQLSMCIVGAIVNIMTVVTLHKNGTGFQSCVSRLKVVSFIYFSAINFKFSTFALCDFSSFWLRKENTLCDVFCLFVCVRCM